MSWAQLVLDAVGLLPGIGMFGKGIKVVRTGKAALTAARLGMGSGANRQFTSSYVLRADIVGGFGKAGW